MGYSGVIVFGDSLVDAGNVLALAKWYDGLPFTEPVDAAPTADKGYYSGRFTNGFTFADLISNKYLGIATKPVFPFGYKDPYIGVPIAPFASDPSGHNLNFAYGGAQMRQGDEKVPDIDGQTDAWRDAVDGHADLNALHMFAFGANDVHDLVPKTGAWASLSTAQATLTKAADRFIHEILQTIDDGVNHVLVIGVPDIGIQPYYNGLVDETARRAVATQYAQMLDDMIQARINALQLPADVEFKYVSFTGMAGQVIGLLDDEFGGTVAGYRLYFMDAFSGRIRSFHEFEAKDDEQAIAVAGDARGRSRSELWCRQRKVMSWPANFEMPDDKAAE